MSETDIIVVGAGIAGVSAAAELSVRRRVLLLEGEDHPGYHTSGRSAALFSEIYGNATVRGLTVATRSFLENPPEGFAEAPILTPRGALHVGGEADRQKLTRIHAEGHALVKSVRLVEAAEALRLLPALRSERVALGVFEPEARDIDTNAVLQGYLRLLRGRGGRLVTRASVSEVSREGGLWHVTTRAGTFAAPILINAAGAWADELASLGGLAPLGIVPKRRTAFVFEPPAGLSTRDWPLVIGADEDFYVKPDAGLLLGSPADETPSRPTDAQPEELDIAVAVERIEAMLALEVRRIVRRWAGLRSFAADKTPVAGFDPRAEGFFWLAGQGGYGFQTCQALAQATAALVEGGTLPEGVARFGVAEAALSPARLVGREVREQGRETIA